MKVTEFNVGRWCLSEDECIARGIDFPAYERGVSDAAKAFSMNEICDPYGEPTKNAAAPAQAVEADSERPGKYMTVVYRGVRPGDEARALLDHPKMSAASWSHALDDRDAARAALSASPAAQPEPTIRERDMAMMIRRLCSHTASQKTREQAMELLCKHGLQGSPLRAASPAAQEAPAATAWGSLTNDEVLKIAPMMGNFGADERDAFCAGFRRCAQALAASPAAAPPEPTDTERSTPENEQRLMRLLSEALGSRHPAMDDLARLIFDARKGRAAMSASTQPDTKEQGDA